LAAGGHTAFFFFLDYKDCTVAFYQNNCCYD